MRVCVCLIIYIFFFANFSAAQICKPSSIPATFPNSQSMDNGDGTISDTKTGLMWKKCVEGVSGDDCASGTAATFTWQQALEQPATVNVSDGFAGYNDWRLPNIKELASIVERQCYDPAINLNRFPNTSNSYAWSSSPSVDNSSNAWGVYFRGGNWDYYFFGRDNNGQVRLVRGGL